MINAARIGSCFGDGRGQGGGLGGIVVEIDERMGILGHAVKYALGVLEVERNPDGRWQLLTGGTVMDCI